MLPALVIVFREAIEAGLIVGIVLAATKGVARRGLWVAYGIAGGVVGACVVATFASRLAGLFQGTGQELFNAGVLALAVIMLTWHNVWMSSHGRAIAEDMKKVGAAVASGERTLMALSIVVGVAVLREGSEVVLFLYGIASQGGTTQSAMLAGGSLGLLGGGLLSALMYLGLLAIPAGRLFAVTSALITLLAAGMASQAVLFLQQAGYLNTLTTPVWDTSWLLPQEGPGFAGILGRMLHTLIGYSDAPSGAQLIAYAATVVTIGALMQFAGKALPRQRAGRARPLHRHA
jgi:high-affinity iron transporter